MSELAVPLSELVSFVEDYLCVSDFNDASFNGLQVSGKQEIKKIVGGVTANLALFKEAKERDAYLVITHHGLYWKHADPRLIGVLGVRVKALGEMSLGAWHLPLDAHEEIGNNALLIKMLGAENLGWLGGDKRNITMLGLFENPVSLEELTLKVKKELASEPLVMGPKDRKIKKIAVCSGAGGFLLDGPLPLDIDAILTGEVHEQHWHLALERGISTIVAGHHATECCGIKALTELLGKKFGISTEFVNIKSPL